MLWRKVSFSGEFDHEHEMYLGPRTWRSIPGFHIVTPMRRDDGYFFI